MKQYVIGMDFGTLSARALLIDTTDGSETAVAEYIYPHGILPTDYFPGITLDAVTMLQHPQDYLDAAMFTLRELLQKTGIDPTCVKAIGVDFTSSTVLPVTADGTPLCFLPEFQNEPQAYVKLWNHHGAQAEADQITQIAAQRNEPWLINYGNRVSSEWLMPKLYEVYNKAPEVFNRTERYLEAGDWLVWQLTGTESHSSSMAGYKALWQSGSGYPSNDFWAAVDPALSQIIGTKVAPDVIPMGCVAGYLTEKAAAESGLVAGITVAAPCIDAHAALPAAGITSSGKLMIIAGTSCCHLLLADEMHPVDGICGCVPDGMIPGFVAYEGSQGSFGDMFGWFVENCVPASYHAEAAANSKKLFALLDEKASQLKIGESGILVLDWWNGNRMPLSDFDLTGTILGLTLRTKPEHIYRGILEAAAFGTKSVVDLLTDNGVEIREVYAGGGISKKNPFLMQMMADVLGMTIRVVETNQAGAKGIAAIAAVAGGCFTTLEEAAAVIADPCNTVYTPNAECTELYRPLYEEYKSLVEYFGKINPVLKKLHKHN